MKMLWKQVSLRFFLLLAKVAFWIGVPSAVGVYFWLQGYADEVTSGLPAWIALMLGWP